MPISFHPKLGYFCLSRTQAVQTASCQGGHPHPIHKLCTAALDHSGKMLMGLKKFGTSQLESLNTSIQKLEI